ncbi:MAG: DinB family protein [Armatimonadota bacterium]
MDQLGYIQLCKADAEEGMAIFLRNFSRVPAEKLNWTPAPTSKSALRIAAHTALYYSRFAEMIRNRATTRVEDLEAWLSERNSEEVAITSAEEIKAAFVEGLREVNDALDSLSAEEVDLVIDSGQGWTMPMRFLMKLPGWHATLHTGQIDYLQTCWDDQEVYVG